MKYAVFFSLSLAASFVCGAVMMPRIVPGPERIVEVPGPERVIHDPPDTTELDSLRVRLQAAEARADRLWKEGWEAGWHKGHDDSRQAAPVVHSTGEQGSSMRFYRWRSR